MPVRNRRSSKEKLKRRHRRRRLVALSVLCVLLVGIYFGGRLFFQTHFFPGSKINGVNCGWTNAQNSYQKISDYLSNYSLMIHSEEGDLQVHADDVGLIYENSGELDGILQQQDANRWFLHLNNQSQCQIMKTSLDDEKLKKTVENLACMKPKEVRKSTNATILYNEEKECFEIKEGELGNEVNLELFTEGVKTAMLDGKEDLDLLGGAYYLPGQYTASSKKVIKAKEKADGYLQARVHYKRKNIELDLKPKRISTFISIDENYKVHINKDVISKYVEEKVASKFDTTKSLTILETPGSGKIYVANGEGGIAVDVADETNRLVKELKAGKPVTREPKYVTDYLYSSNAGIIKKDYVDINISQQKVYVVKKGEIVVSSDCVTGNVSAGRSTPTGIYRIAYKTRNHTMVKYNSFVNYWMPYDTRYGIGLHDATWRSQFGGRIFETDGSHACINLPLRKAAVIYEEVYSGIPVIVHW